MKHLILSREYPPAPYAPGGIGTYVRNIARILAERGEIVHVIGQRWKDAPKMREVLCEGRLIIHRIAEDDPPRGLAPLDLDGQWAEDLAGVKRSVFPNQWFSLQAAHLAERLIQEEGIDVVEAQEWEAPLYHFLVRRSLGLGPARKPPCIIHLHSPTEMIARSNGVDLRDPTILAMKRMEDHCIAAADALLCPSRYLARQSEDLYDLPRDSVKVIRLPVGSLSTVERDERTWDEGMITYVGRLEARKGVGEWVEAAIRVARDDPKVQFDFIGADTPTGWTDPSRNRSMVATLQARIPQAMRHRFRFHGAKPRDELPALLARARAAVVPSRWENFPNTCIEAMASGLPVIATRLGGMAEMLEDGRTGWLAPGDTMAEMVDGLEQALRRCLAETPARRQAMGAAAAEAVRELCDNDRTFQEHVAFRTEVARRGGRRSAVLPGASRAAAEARRGIGVVAWIDGAEGAEAMLDSLTAQTLAPAALAFVHDPAAVPSGLALERRARAAGGIAMAAAPLAAAEAWNQGFQALRGVRPPLGWVFLDRHDRLRPDALAKLEAALASCPQAGIVSFWTASADGHVSAPPCPGFPHQWAQNEVARASAFRDEAIEGAAPFPPDVPAEGDLWALANGVLGRGWKSVVYPEFLARRESAGTMDWTRLPAYQETRRRLLKRLPAPAPADFLAYLDLHAPLPAIAPPLPPAHQPQPPRFARLRRHKLFRALLEPHRIGPGLARRWGRIKQRLRPAANPSLERAS